MFLKLKSTLHSDLQMHRALDIVGQLSSADITATWYSPRRLRQLVSTQFLYAHFYKFISNCTSK